MNLTLLQRKNVNSLQSLLPILLIVTLADIIATNAAFLQGEKFHPTALSSIHGHSLCHQHLSNYPSNLLLCMNASPSSTRAVDFHGTAKSEIFVPQQRNGNTATILDREIRTGGGTNGDDLGAATMTIINSAASTETYTITLQDFLQSTDSTSALLGTEDYAVRNDGYYDCIQPSIGWFGMQLKPVFVNRLDKNLCESTSEVKIQIVGARTNIVKTKQKDDEPSTTTPLVAKLMEKCNFEGTSTLLVREDDEGWHMSFDLKLLLQLSLPPRVPLPPGFKIIGSRIVSTTCSKRARQTLNHIKDAYEAWVSEQMDSYIRDAEQTAKAFPLSDEDELRIEIKDMNDIDITNDIAHLSTRRRSWRKRIISKLRLPRRLRSRR